MSPIRPLKSPTRSGLLRRALCAALPALLAMPALAQAQQAAAPFPSRTVTLIVNGGAGSLPDLFARPLAEKLHATLGQPVVVDNRPGAGGMVAMKQLKESEPSGHTLAIITNAHAVWSPYIFPKLSYEPARDLLPVSPIAVLPMALVAHPGLGAANVAELVEKAKAQPGVLNYASSGNGSPPHVLFEFWRRQAGIELQHIPFKTGPDALTATLAGDTQLYFAGTALVEPMVRQQRLKVLAVSPKVDSPSFAGAPTLEQAGYPGFESAVWLGVAAPAGTPQAVVEQLNQAIGQALRDPGFIDTMRRNGSIPLHESATAFAQRIEQERSHWGPQLQKLGILPD
ncbi:Bug family tripartite tricarboxylate transporter substrate binding protein [Vandammella animalimorsus]|uniref:Bug family tripartite tricarboxylate transporter substrate binding protein n=1 Tax=Vandammella animalimorsus TaxID=2029117 RepID=UPI001EEEF299|nr:tripartite tricarboxylate transporter substrate binding protein [Vandammella animalimorsus]